MMRGHSAQQGFTLIEILVAVLVLSIGVLGLVGLESVSLQNNQGAYHRSQATLLSYELADRIRANPAVDYSARTASNNGCRSYAGAATACTNVQLAEQDLFDWQGNVQRVLPLGVGNAPTLSGATYSISISWDSTRDGLLDESFSFDFEI